MVGVFQALEAGNHLFPRPWKTLCTCTSLPVRALSLIFPAASRLRCKKLMEYVLRGGHVWRLLLSTKGLCHVELSLP